jgi:hypothetical protein
MGTQVKIKKADKTADKPGTAVVLHLYPNQREDVANAVKYAFDLQTGCPRWTQELEDLLIVVAEQEYARAIRGGKKPFNAAFAAACEIVKNGGKHVPA